MFCFLSFFCSFVRSFVRSLVRSFARSLVRSFARSLVRSFARSLVRIFLHSEIKYENVWCQQDWDRVNRIPFSSTVLKNGLKSRFKGVGELDRRTIKFSGEGKTPTV